MEDTPINEINEPMEPAGESKDGEAQGAFSGSPDLREPVRGNLRGQLPYLALFAILLLILSLSSIRQRPATFDEGAHLPAGYSYIAFDDYRMNMEHPPLIKLISGLSLRSARPRAEIEDSSWKTADQFHFGEKFLYEWNDADRMLLLGRAPIILLSILFGIGVFFCARDFYGAKAGYVALALYLFSPDLLAHGQLVTTDLGIAGLMFLAVYAFHRALRQLNPANFLLFVLASSLTVVTKFSGALLFPILALVGIAFSFSSTPITLRLSKKSSLRREVSSLFGKLATAGVMIALAASLSVVTIWTCYGWRYHLAPDPKVSEGLNWSQFWITPGLIIDSMQTARERRLLPEAFIYGFLRAQESTETRNAFLLGERSDHGWWYYFLVTFAVKTPIPLLILILLGLVFVRRYGSGWLNEVTLLAPVIVYLGVALSSNLNIGHRHLLPIYPFLIVSASKLGRVFDSMRPRALVVVCAILLGWNAIETVKIYPHFLAYFNQIAGGPEKGYQWLVDSNLDWGQDLKELAEYRREHPEEPFFLSYFGSAKPEYYGIKARFLPAFNPGNQRREMAAFGDVPSGAIVAVSATSLQCANLSNREAPGAEEFMAGLRKLKPIATIGYSIFIYRVP